MKISRRMVVHTAKTQQKLRIRSRWIYDWESELFWGSVWRVGQARLDNAQYMNRRKTNGYNSYRPDFRGAQLWHKRRMAVLNAEAKVKAEALETII